MTLKFECYIPHTEDTVGGSTIVWFQALEEFFKGRKGEDRRNIPWNIIFSNVAVKARDENYKSGDKVKITIEKINENKGFPRNIID